MLIAAVRVCVLYSIAFAGIDIGSRTIALIVIDENRQVLERRLSNTGFDTLAEVGTVMDEVPFA